MSLVYLKALIWDEFPLNDLKKKLNEFYE